MEIDGVKTDPEEPHLSLQKYETVQHLAVNLMDDYLCIKEEPLQQVSPILSNIDMALVYTTRIDDMPFLMKSKNLIDVGYKKCLDKIESDSKPKFTPGITVTRKRKLTLHTYMQYFIMKKKLHLLAENTRLLKLCNAVNVVLEKFPSIEQNIPNIINDKVKKKKNDGKSKIKISPKNITEVSDSEDDQPLVKIKTSEKKKSPIITIPQNKITKPLELNPGNIDKPKLCCSLYFHDTYFNSTVVCGVDKIGIIKVYFECHGIRNVQVDEILAVYNTSFIHTFLRCCWYSFDERIRKIWNLQESNYNFLSKSHTCSLDTCRCCCRKKKISPTKNNLKVTCCEKQLTFSNKVKDNFKLRKQVTALIGRNILKLKKVNESPPNHVFKEIIDNQTTFIQIKNIETFQSELYYLTKNRNVGGYYIKSYKCKMPIITEFTNFASNLCKKINFVVCCWVKREHEIASTLKIKLNCTNPAILRYMKRFHLCEPQNCKCCCKFNFKLDIKKPQLTLKPLILPNIRKHTVKNRPIHNNRKINILTTKDIQQNQSVDIQMDENIPHTRGKNGVENHELVNPNASINPSLKAIIQPSTKQALNKVLTHELVTPLALKHPSVNAKIPTRTKRPRIIIKRRTLEEKTPSPSMDKQQQRLSGTKPIKICDDAQSNKTIIKQVPDIVISRALSNSMNNIVLTVDDNRKVAAALPAPANTYSPEELHVLADILKKAQEQIISFGLLPGTKINIMKSLPVPNLDLGTVPCIISQKNKSQLQNMYKELTEATVLKMQNYKKYFYYGKKLQALKHKESNIIHNENESTTTKHLGEGIKEKVAGPCGIALSFPSTSRVLPNVYQNPRMYSSGDVAELTRIVKTDSPESSDDQIDDEYDIEHSEHLVDIKPVIYDDITIEENDAIASDSGGECILGS